MKNKYLHFTTIIIAGLLFFSACVAVDAEDDALPIGHPGGISCKVDGEEWWPERPDIWTPFQLQYYYDTGSFELFAKRKLADGSTNQSMFFGTDNLVLGENQLRERRGAFFDWHQ